MLAEQSLTVDTSHPNSDPSSPLRAATPQLGRFATKDRGGPGPIPTWSRNRLGHAEECAHVMPTAIHPMNTSEGTASLGAPGKRGERGKVSDPEAGAPVKSPDSGNFA